MVTIIGNNSKNPITISSKLPSFNQEISESIIFKLRNTYFHFINELPFFNKLKQPRYFDASSFKLVPHLFLKKLKLMEERIVMNMMRSKLISFLLVLDGVGSWSKEGIDPSIFPKQLGKE